MEAGRRGGGRLCDTRRVRTLGRVVVALKRCELCQHAGNKRQDKTFREQFTKIKWPFENMPGAHLQSVKLFDPAQQT